ncbi:MAG TPA: hypothetical protein VF533_04885 [Solirubrobacteraceae bacterium]|jgi:Flp pilus assembly protein TadG
MRRVHGPESGQASVELVALLPLIAALGFGLMQVLAAGAAGEAAEAAAEAGAVALLQDADARDAARAAMPEWARDRAAIRVRARRVEIEVRPRGPVPVLTRVLTATATAHAGPVPSASAAGPVHTAALLVPPAPLHRLAANGGAR